MNVKKTVIALSILTAPYSMNTAMAQSSLDKTYRPAYHFAPAKNWTNDPNGLVFYNGLYHLFFQYNPQGDTWGHMSWGHAVSKDLIAWTEWPVALEDYKNEDGTTTMFFSGTAVEDKNNTSGLATKAGEKPLVAIYTAHRDSSGTGINQNQSMAYSLDGKTFKRYSHNPLIDLHTRDFRDPKVFWYAQENKWIMVVSKPLDYQIEMYSSPDLKNWKWMSSFDGPHGDKAKIWECPDFFPLKADSKSGKVKWVLTLSGAHPYHKNYEGMQYFVGDFDGTHFTADPLSYPLYIDYGKDYYAGIIWNNLPQKDERKIMLGWVNSWEYANKIPTKGFRGQFSIPRELSLYENTQHEYRLKANPIKELNAYRAAKLLDKKQLTVKNVVALPTVKGDALDINFILTPNQKGKSGIRLLANGSQSTEIYYDPSDNSIKIDRTKSGITDFSDKFPSVDEVKLPENYQHIPVRILVDKCIVEVYINNGEQNMTELVFPKGAQLNTSLISEGGSSSFENLKVWQMKSSMKNVK